MIQLDQLTKVYGHGAGATTVLDHLDFEIAAGEIFAVVGPSGAGKSTLAQTVSLLERPTSGRVVVNGADLTALGERELRAARRRIGTIFQSDGLFSRRTAAQNVALPLEFLGVTPGERRTRVAELLERVGLSAKAGHYPHQLSGGQRQRVGIARALALRPSVLLADEATSGLDPASTASIVGLLKELRDELGLSILFITHEMDTVVQLADAVARLDHGRIAESGRLLDLLRDPASVLGTLLRPPQPGVPAAPGELAIDVSYTGEVAGDWLARVSRAVGADLHVLGARIEQVHGETVGTARLAAPAELRGRLLPLLAAAGLSAHPVGSDAAPALEVVA
ncbi:methionine ABC transporter ATP-binding protein [Protaetiibacter mangrovi]|uniref:ATP-binding cassette domain-containing protein n=1 Tax=Protaetiibacter mangrovi TaxID=2970926 RepID=A0ABT1ZCR6_9MICO|nr:ATP-binding cassette domain-containing protein [Protaetiibacter mangrovi]MCS0498490.1 ATP-binding cassette domain-containing protein [Protaetiibacter mangrovi]TPX02867.1 ATP-binding cassette domain-containing protein [Schumannella luteola]